MTEKIFTFTSRRKEHVYLKLLYDNLEKEGFFQRDYYKFRDIFKLFNSKIIHLHWIENYMYSKKGYINSLFKFSFILTFFFLLKIYGKKFIITLHNVVSHDNKFPNFEKKGFKIYLNNLANKIICHNNYSKTEASRLYSIDERKLVMIPHMSFLSFYQNDIPKCEARRKLGIPINSRVVLFFGSQAIYKGKKSMLGIIKLFLEKGYYCILAGNIGDSSLRNSLREILLKNKKLLVFDKYIPDEDIQIYMNCCDVGILPYTKISTSGIAYLFASFKKPLICSDLIPFKESFKEGALYYQDKRDLKDKLSLLNKKRLKKMSTIMFNISKKNSPKNIARKTAQVYKKLI